MQLIIVYDSTYVFTEEPTSCDRTVQAATLLLRDKYHIFNSTIQAEAFNESIMSSCDQCIGPKET